MFERYNQKVHETISVNVKFNAFYSTFTNFLFFLSCLGF